MVVDVRRDSPTAGMVFTIVLEEEGLNQIWIPPGLAHGFCVISRLAVVHYKCTEFYSPQSEAGVRWNDPDLDIKWPVNDPDLSDKDRSWPFLADISFVSVG